MGLLDFLEEITQKIVSKNKEAFAELQDTFDLAKIDDSDVQSQNQNSQNQKPENENDQIQYFNYEGGNHQNELNRNQSQSVFDKIANKNLQAIQELFSKIQQIQLEDQIEETIQKQEQFKFSPHIQTAKNKKQQSLNTHNNGQTRKRHTIRLKSINKQRIKIKQQKHQNEIQNRNQNENQNSSLKLYKQKLKVYTQNSQQNSNYLQTNQLSSDELMQIKKISGKEILGQLQQIHKKKAKQSNEHKHIHKSLNTRARIMKINPEATLQNRERKKMEAEKKLKENIQFLERLKIKQKYETPSIKQFKNDIQQIRKLKANLKVKAAKKDQKLFDLKTSKRDIIQMNEYLYSNSDHKKEKSFHVERSVNIFNESSQRLFPPIQKKQTIRPKPYSIYNVYQRNNQMFTNSPVAQR